MQSNVRYQSFASVLHLRPHLSGRLHERDAKGQKRKNFNGLISYLLKPASHHKSAPYVIGGNVIESFAEALSAEFNATKLLRSDVSKPVWHNSLRQPVGESLPIQQWKKIADDYREEIIIWQRLTYILLHHLAIQN